MSADATDVSIVLPFGNAADTIADAIDSLRCQTLSTFECILIDNRSSDASRSIAQTICRIDSRFRIITHPGSFVAALNAGCTAAGSALIARMDADDVAAPRRLEAQRALLAADSTLALASCLVSAFPAATLRDGMDRYVGWSNSVCSPDRIRESLFIESPLIHPSVMIRRAALEHAGGYLESDGPEDYDLWLRLLLAGGRAAKVPEVLLYWRDHASRLTRTDPHYAAARIFETKRRYLPRVLPLGSNVQICGAGPIGRRWAHALRQLGYRVRRFVDVDTKKQGRMIGGAAVVSPQDLDPADGFVLAAVGVPGARAQIETYLQTHGLRAWHDYLAVA
jgi:glycosyltransferase involved in cell wall biosynthesis